MGLRQMAGNINMQLDQMTDKKTGEFNAEVKKMIQENPQLEQQFNDLRKQSKALNNVVNLFDYLESSDNEPKQMMPPSMGGAY